MPAFYPYRYIQFVTSTSTNVDTTTTSTASSPDQSTYCPNEDIDMRINTRLRRRRSEMERDEVRYMYKMNYLVLNHRSRIEEILLHHGLGRPILWPQPPFTQSQREVIMSYIALNQKRGQLTRELATADDPRLVWAFIEFAHENAAVIGWTPREFYATVTDRLASPAVLQFKTLQQMRRYNMPWHRRGWWTNSPLSVLHMARPSTDHLGQISYYPNADKMARDVSVAVKPGRYLMKYFGKGTKAGLSDADVRAYAAEFTNAVIGHALHFTDAPTAENRDKVAAEWKRIYHDGPQTCMKGYDAVKIYAYPGNSLRLAHFTVNDKPGAQPVARCIVRDDKKHWVRIYPDDQGTLWQDMLAKLTNLGYEHGNLDGVSLRLMRDGGDIVCPYIDEGNGGSQSVSVHSRHLLCGGDEHDACQTSGFLEDRDRYVCVSCDSRIGEDEVMNYGDNDYCPQCYRDNFIAAMGRHGSDDYPRSECIRCESDGRMYHDSALRTFEIQACDASGDFYFGVDLVQLSDGRYVHPRYQEELAKELNKVAVGRR
jgi:hypothetical protein